MVGRVYYGRVANGKDALPRFWSWVNRCLSVLALEIRDASSWFLSMTFWVSWVSVAQLSFPFRHSSVEPHNGDSRYTRRRVHEEDFFRERKLANLSFLVFFRFLLSVRSLSVQYSWVVHLLVSVDFHASSSMFLEIAFKASTFIFLSMPTHATQ